MKGDVDKYRKKKALEDKIRTAYVNRHMFGDETVYAIAESIGVSIATMSNVTSKMTPHEAMNYRNK